MAAGIVNLQASLPDERPALELSMVNRLEHIPRLAEELDAFGQMQGVPPRVLHDVQVSLDEVLSNIVNHAYDDAREHAIQVRIWLRPGQMITEVVDDGRPFNPLEAPAVPARRGAAAGGLGIHFVRRLVDHLSYERSGHVNRLVMRSTLPGPCR